MTYQELLENATKTLTAANVPDAKTDAWRLFEHFTGMNRAAFFMALREEIPEKNEIAVFQDAIGKRAQRIPLQYITGTQDFFGREFKVSPATLIPRYDTEVVVEESLKLIRKYCETNVTAAEDVSILDLCTGTGCIIITLSEKLGAKLCVGTDVSPEAVALAKENASRLGCEGIVFCSGDLYEALEHEGLETKMFDVIVSNPPYIKTKEIEELSPEVRDHEPMTALDGSADGLLFYRRICRDAHMHIKPGGLLIFEIGSDEGTDVSAIMEQSGFCNIKIIKDLAGLDRVAAGTYGGRHV